MRRCSIGLGGNLGDVGATFSSALSRLARSQCVVVSVSRLYATRPVGPQAGDDFQNASALLDTRLTPRELLDLIHEIEDEAGRTRTVRWGSRPLDIDLLTYGELVRDDPHLTLPHPGLVYRRFVLDPLAEITPELVHPVVRRTVSDLRQRLNARPLPLVLRGGDDTRRRRLAAQLDDRFPKMLRIKLDGAVGAALDPTVIHLGPPPPAGEQEPPNAIVVPIDARLALEDPDAAAIAVVTAMLDEPQAGEPIGVLDG